MIRISSTQMTELVRRRFHDRVEQFIDRRCRRDDFRSWAGDRGRLAALWRPLDAADPRASEHDLALTMVLLAACTHAGVELGGSPLRVLDGVASGEVKVKQWLAEQGYFDFTAFDADAPEPVAETAAR